MPRKKKNNQPVRVSLRKRLLTLPTSVKNYCSGIMLKVQLLMENTKITQKKTVKKSSSVKKKK
tara:strand:+ start:83 stop:271 length:189 start_codon:yes stop_codon:yes gene_type:complete